MSDVTAASASKLSMRGVVTGNQFIAQPPPPDADLLDAPLVVPDLSFAKRPHPGFGAKMRRRLAGMRLTTLDADARLYWRYQDTLDLLMASVGPAPSRPELPKGVRPVTVRHPYHLRMMFDLLTSLPDGMAAERKFLDRSLNSVLRRFGERMQEAKGVPFSFENEAREFFYAGFKGERQIKRLDNPDERFNALQAIHTSYFHGRNYYVFALLRKERLDPENKLFMLFVRAVHFMSRVDWNGTLLDKPAPRSLPTRMDLMFYLRRDPTVIERYKTDPDFQRQIRTVLEIFPK